jgi:GT2 family glycosyltransferase
LSAIAVVIVTYNSARHLPATLDALSAELGPDDELRVVDCGSSDDPAAVIARHAPRAVFTPLGDNRGFAGGASTGARATGAPLLLFLNPDCVVQPGALATLRAAAAERPSWGAWQALVTLPGGRTINTSGGVTHWLGFGWTGEYEHPVPPPDAPPHEVSFASGAALIVRREAWEAAGGFEPAYFMYAEDVDLALRLRLAGWGVGVVPAARVEHDYEFAKGDYKWFLLERNRWWTVLAAYPAGLLLLLLPALLGAELALLAIATRGGWLRAKLRAQWAVIRTLPWSLKRRRRVQATRRVSARAFAASLTDRLDSPFLGPAAEIPAARTIQSAYWATALRFARGGHR